jgi:hypothetical protein
VGGDPVRPHPVGRHHLSVSPRLGHDADRDRRHPGHCPHRVGGDANGGIEFQSDDARRHRRGHRPRHRRRHRRGGGHLRQMRHRPASHRGHSFGDRGNLPPARRFHAHPGGGVHSAGVPRRDHGRLLPRPGTDDGGVAADLARPGGDAHAVAGGMVHPGWRPPGARPGSRRRRGRLRLAPHHRPLRDRRAHSAAISVADTARLRPRARRGDRALRKSRERFSPTDGRRRLHHRLPLAVWNEPRGNQSPIAAGGRDSARHARGGRLFAAHRRAPRAGHRRAEHRRFPGQAAARPAAAHPGRDRRAARRVPRRRSREFSPTSSAISPGRRSRSK